MESESKKAKEWPTVASDEDWLTARKELLEAEKQFSVARQRLTAARQGLPMRAVGKDYVFHDTKGGQVHFSDLFTHGKNLVVYHMMMQDDWDNACKNCAAIIDGFCGPTLPHIETHAKLIVVSSASWKKLAELVKKKGWDVPLFSSAGTTFGSDFKVEFTEEEVASQAPIYNYGKSKTWGKQAHGLSVFYKMPGKPPLHSYSTYSRGVENLMLPLSIFDLLPEGRQEMHPLSWIKHREEY